MSATQLAIEATDLRKRFGNTLAVESVDLAVERSARGFPSALVCTHARRTQT
ncbi:ABC transporter-related protein [Natrinema gari JCM 14663]|uniref:ABC transporter-related protein n=1 Tax=Natrinema gari JCM 14663 TaxID=1230459 RepID=L9Z9I2_9EURY|nr:ABC transporter-related protein [Natrinema gari JCM 14663]